MATSFTITQTTQSDKKITRSITNINPEASDGQIAALAQGLNNLTTNRLDGVDRVDKRDIDTSETYYTPEVSMEVAVGEASNYTFADNVLTVKYNNLPADQANADGIIFSFTINSSEIAQFSKTVTTTRKTTYGFDIATADLPAVGVYCYKFTSGTLSPEEISNFEQTITIPQGKVTVGQDVLIHNAVTITIKLTA